MSTLGLLNGKRYDIKENADKIDELIGCAETWVELTLIRNYLSSDAKEEKTRFMVNAIAYWY